MISLSTPSAFASLNLDYLVVGGGTAGLAVAARLSEDSRTSVGVLEAGGDHTTDPAVLIPGLSLSQFNKPEYDWALHTTPQESGNGRVVALPRGRQLGGSSALNYLYWTHASQSDINDWGELGNKNWSWEILAPYYSKSENYDAPDSEVTSQIDTSYIDPAEHGDGGPLQNQFPPSYNDFYEAWVPTYDNLGVNFGPRGDPRSGLFTGAYPTLVSQEPTNNSRCYSATAYWKPGSSRPNLHVLTNATATKVNFKPGSKPLIATGADFISGNQSYTVKVTKEVILSAGSYQSPQLLELSGIGSREMLSQHGIEVLYSNPFVGENLQDHVLAPLSFQTIPGEPTSESFRNLTVFAEVLSQYQINHTGPLTANTANSFISLSQAEHTYTHHPSSFLPPLPSPDNKTASALTLRKILSSNETTFQIAYLPGGCTPSASANSSAYFSTDAPDNYLTILVLFNHPFSRGTVHITSPSPLAPPEIDHKYLTSPLDSAILARGLLHAQTVASTPPFSHLLLNNGTVSAPGFHRLSSVAAAEQWAKQSYSSGYHPLGSCSMLPESAGGVVDEKFKVYGTANLRVVDASVIPIAPRGNLQTLVYAIAERAADFIKEDAAGGGAGEGETWVREELV